MKVDSIKLVQKLKLKEAEAARGDGASVVVGYNRVGGLALHEMVPKRMGQPRPSGLGVRWGPSMTGNKFLLNPARELARQVAEAIRTTYAKTKDWLQSLFMGALLVQRESQKRVPVEHGDLKRSAFTEKE